ncbi:hypothetical protein CR513_54628, partial [Mucuna pruriens]
MSYVPPYQPRVDIGIATTPRPAQQGTRRSPRTLTPIPMTYTELLPRLLEQKLVEIVPLRPLVLPYPRSYEPNAMCDYHGGAVGHAIESSATRKPRTIWTWLHGAYKEKKTKAEDPGYAMDTVEPLSPFH